MAVRWEWNCCVLLMGQIAYFKKKVSMHELGIQDVLVALELLEKPVKDVVILGIQPAVIDVGLELSPTVQDTMPHTVKNVIGVLDSWGIKGDVIQTAL